MNYLITIIGPTAIGKTALSIALAQYYNCEIISCDSRQFFNEMKIGTAVPTDEELATVNHHFIQNKSIFENYTVGNFEKEALATLDELFLKNNVQIMVGGSGLYVDAILKGLDNFPEIAPQIRALVKHNYETFGLHYLQETLLKLDSKYYNFLLKNNLQTLQNPQRMMRFVEVCLGSGNSYSSFIEKEKVSRNFAPIIIGLEAERQIIYNRINQRVDTMIHDGLVIEAEKLFPNRELNALQTVGYRELFQYFDSNIEDSRLLENAIEEIKKNTRRFSKRQLTWFKKTENVTWFDYLTDRNIIIEHINHKIPDS